MTLSLDELRGHITSSLGDDALQLLLDAAYEAIEEYLGIDAGTYTAAVTEMLPKPSGDRVMLSRRAIAITSITEGDVELEADDYSLLPSGLTVLRLADGTNPARSWRNDLEVVYEPYSDGANRDRVAIALVNLDINYSPGLTGASVGPWSEQYGQGAGSYMSERDAILASLRARKVIML